MGTLTYASLHLEFEDRLLQHLQIVIIQKFRRHEAFLMSWKESASAGDGRAAIWLTPNVPISFKFYGSKAPSVNRDWLSSLGRSADSSTGLIVTREDGELALASPDSGQPGTAHHKWH